MFGGVGTLIAAVIIGFCIVSLIHKQKFFTCKILTAFLCLFGIAVLLFVSIYSGMIIVLTVVVIYVFLSKKESKCDVAEKKGKMDSNYTTGELVENDNFYSKRAVIKENTTMGESIPRKQIIRLLGMVSGSSYYNPAGIIGEGYTDKVGNLYMKSAIDNATEKMLEQAVKMGADGIISCKTVTSQGGLNNTVVTVTGTAVTLKDKADAESLNKQVLSGADEIMKYKQLMDSGIISSEEFEKKKKQILEI